MCASLPPTCTCPPTRECVLAWKQNVQFNGQKSHTSPLSTFNLLFFWWYIPNKHTKREKWEHKLPPTFSVLYHRRWVILGVIWTVGEKTDRVVLQQWSVWLSLQLVKEMDILLQQTVESFRQGWAGGGHYSWLKSQWFVLCMEACSSTDSNSTSVT